MISMTPNFATGKPDRVVYWREVVGHTVSGATWRR